MFAFLRLIQTILFAIGRVLAVVPNSIFMLADALDPYVLAEFFWSTPEDDCETNNNEEENEDN